MAADPTQLIQNLLGAGGFAGAAAAQGTQDYNAAQLAPVQLQQGQQQVQLGQQQIDANNAATAQAAQYQNDVKAWGDGGSTPQGLTDLIAKYPAQYQALRAGWAVKNDDQSKSDLSFFGGVHALIANNDLPGAAAYINKRLAAEKAIGVDTTKEQALADEIATGKPESVAAAKQFALSQIAAGVGPDKVSDAYKTVRGDYSLEPNQQHFDGNNQLVATGAPKPTDNTPEYQYDSGLHKWVMKPFSGGGVPSSGAGGATDEASGPATGDTSRLVNSDAGGGQVPAGVQTLGQFVGWGRSKNAAGAKSSSAGTYQINGTTMAEFGPKALGPNWKTAPYNADTQDKVGEAIFNWAQGQPDPAAALRGRWVSLSPAAAAQAVSGSWQQARGMIAQGETGGGPGASAAMSASATGGGAGNGPDPFHGYPASVDVAMDPADKSGGLTPQALGYAADYAIQNGGKLPQGFGRSKGAAVAIENAIADRAAKAGMSVQQIIQLGQDKTAAGKTLLGFTVGKQADATRSLSVSIDHLSVLHDAMLALKNGDVRLFNRVANSWLQGTGSALPTNAKAISGIVADEVSKAVLGSNGAVSDREDLKKTLDTNGQSPAQALGAINSYIGLMSGQARGLQRQYEQGTGRHDFQRFLSPIAARNLGFGSGGGQSRTAGAPVPTKTATGAGGVKMGLVNGQWVPIH